MIELIIKIVCLIYVGIFIYLRYKDFKYFEKIEKEIKQLKEDYNKGELE